MLRISLPASARYYRSSTASRLRRAITCAPHLETRWTFCAREMLCPDGRARRWALRDGGFVVLRSGTDDIEIFEEIHALRFYEPPPPVLDILAAAPVREICDIGGHVGLFAEWALRRYGDATVVSFEPDPW